MNRYPVWKYILIAVAVVAGLLYTLPNFFPEVPAVQVSTSKATVKVDASTLAAVESALKAANIPHDGATVETLMRAAAGLPPLASDPGHPPQPFGLIGRYPGGPREDRRVAATR